MELLLALLLAAQAPADLARLRSLGATCQASAVAPLRKLEMQSAAWEALLTDESRPAELAARQLLRCASLSDDEIRRLPDTLPELRAALPDATMLERLQVRHPDVLELLNPTDHHAGAFRGRFYARVFLAVAGHEQQRFRQFLQSASEVRIIGFSWARERQTENMYPFPELRNLPRRFEGVRAVLVLYYNAVKPDLDVVPTNVVASWLEYEIKGRMESGVPAQENAAKIQFRAVHPSRDSPGRRADPQAPATAKCGACHLSATRSLDRVSTDLVIFTPPLVRTPQLGRASETLKKALDRLK